MAAGIKDPAGGRLSPVNVFLSSRVGLLECEATTHTDEGESAQLELDTNMGSGQSSEAAVVTSY